MTAAMGVFPAITTFKASVLKDVVTAVVARMDLRWGGRVEGSVVDDGAVESYRLYLANKIKSMSARGSQNGYQREAYEIVFEADAFVKVRLPDSQRRRAERVVDGP